MEPTSRHKLTDAEVLERLKDRVGWERSRDEITRTFLFESYKDGLVFAVAIGYLADRMDHHPDLTVGYRKVRVGLSTHSAGGLSDLDFDLARQIDCLI